MKRSIAVSLSVVVLFASAALAAITRETVVPAGASLPIIADVDGNGLDDLVYDKYILLAMGSGSFIQRDLNLGEGYDVLDTLDVNGDGIPDLLTANFDGRNPFEMKRPDLPTYRVHIATSPMQWAPGIAIPNNFNSEPFIGDFNDDGKDDILLMHVAKELGFVEVAADLTVALSRGDGIFEKRPAFSVPVSPQWSRQTRHVPMGDLNHDGISDAIIRTTADLVILTGTGGGDFTMKSHYLPSPRFGNWATVLGDVDRDGNLDVVTSGRRVVQVLFGDGHSGFNRNQYLFLPQYRYPGVPGGTSATAIGWSANAPRNLVLGEFVAKGRTEIAGSLVEGDLFVVALVNGRLQEVTPRIATDFLYGDLYPGSFREKGDDDLLVTWNLGDQFHWTTTPADAPKPALFDVNPTETAVNAVPPRTNKGRAVMRPVAAPLKFTVQARDCAQEPTKLLQRDGVWARYQNGAEILEAIIDDEGIFNYRWFPKWEPYGVFNMIERSRNGGWEGTAFTWTPCGDQVIGVQVKE
jgi:hypothetical protein